MRIFGIGCMHGSLVELTDFLSDSNVDLVLSLGDHCNGDEVRDIVFKNWERFKGEKYYEVMRELLGDNFLPTFRRFARSGRDVLQRLDNLGLPILAVQGNNDFSNRDREESQLNLTTYEESCNTSSNIVDISGKVHNGGLNGREYAFVGVPFYRGVGVKEKTDPEWEERDFKMREKLKAALPKTNGSKIVLVGHDMPYNCQLDMIDYPTSPKHGQHVGDEIIREYILENHPMLYVGAHMHEWQDTCKIGKTSVIASGYGREGKGVLIDLPYMSVKFVKL